MNSILGKKRLIKLERTIQGMTLSLYPIVYLKCFSLKRISLFAAFLTFLNLEY